jgi:hypothetical protein
MLCILWQYILVFQEKQLYEYNARNQITLWGPHGEIVDYANKQWAGSSKLLWLMSPTEVKVESSLCLTKHNVIKRFEGEKVQVHGGWLPTLYCSYVTLWERAFIPIIQEAEYAPEPVRMLWWRERISSSAGSEIPN